MWAATFDCYRKFWKKTNKLGRHVIIVKLMLVYFELVQASFVKFHNVNCYNLNENFQSMCVVLMWSLSYKGTLDIIKFWFKC